MVNSRIFTTPPLKCHFERAFTGIRTIQVKGEFVKIREFTLDLIFDIFAHKWKFQVQKTFSIKYFQQFETDKLF